MTTRNALPFTLLAAAGLVAGCAMNGERTEDDRMFGARLPAEFVDADRNAVGSAVLTETANGVLVDVELRDLEPGWHGFHFHERGDCTAPGFESAGEHYNPHADMHGLLVEDGPHAGDLPNIFVDADGTARFQLMADGLSLRNGANALADADGAALVVHSAQDDYRSQPSGDSGTRIACAEIR